MGLLVLSTLSGLLATYSFFWAFLHFTQHVSEPPAVATSIPFISPILGMIRWNMNFYPHLRDKHRNLPIYTLRVPTLRLYVINSIDLIPVVQRQWRTLLFPPVQARAAEFAVGGSKRAISIVRQDMITEEGFVHGMIKSIYPALISGTALDDLTLNAFQSLTNALDKISRPTTIKLSKWIDHQVMLATTDAVYGPHNPMQDESNQRAWSTFHPTIMFLMLNVLPLYIFRKGLKSREHLRKSFASYYAQGKHKQSSEYIQRFIRHLNVQGIPEEDNAPFLLGSLFTVIANTMPTAFWMVYRVFSDPVVLEDCLKEITKAVEEKDDVSIIDATYILNSCPVFLSTYQEVFRVHGMANSVRVVAEDHMLDNKYLLKKGGLVMISARAQHTNPNIWGSNADKFHHKRFIKQSGTAKRPSPVAFRGFGGGTTLCPGRHFATAEILLLTALLLLRFDIVPTVGKWVLPKTDMSSQAEAIEQHDTDIEVQLGHGLEGIASGKSASRDAERPDWR